MGGFWLSAISFIFRETDIKTLSLGDLVANYCESRSFVCLNKRHLQNA